MMHTRRKRPIPWALHRQQQYPTPMPNVNAHANANANKGSSAMGGGARWTAEAITMDGGGAITMDGSDAIGQRRMSRSMR